MTCRISFACFYCVCKVGALEQTRLQLEAKLFDSMKEVKEENIEREAQINRNILMIHEQYGKIVSVWHHNVLNECIKQCSSCFWGLVFPLKLLITN